MKNFKTFYLLVALFAICSLYAQPKPFVISQQLQLKTTPAGVKSDSILVINAEGLVNKVPRSGFSGGGGGSQTLDQTLTLGNTSQTPIQILYPYDGMHADHEGTRFIVVSDTLGTYAQLTINQLNLGGQILPSLVFGGDDFTGRAQIGPADGDTNGIFKLPNKGGSDTDEYTLATLDDISGASPTLQTVLNSGGFASFDSDTKAISIFDPAVGASAFVVQSIETTPSYKSGYLDVTPNGVASIGQGTNGQGSIAIANGEISLNKSLADTGDGAKATQISIADPIANLSDGGGAHLIFPAKPAGTYTLATEEDINIQKVFDAGRLWVSDTTMTDPNMSIMSFGDSTLFGNESTIYMTAHDSINDTESNITIQSVGFGINSKKFPGSGLLQFRGEVVDNENIVVNATRSGMLSGTYDLAYTSDVTLDTAIETNGYASSGTSTVAILEGGAGYEEFTTYMENGLAGDNKSFGSIYNTNTGVILQAKKGPGGFNTTETRVTVSLTDFEIKVSDENNYSQINFEPPVYDDGAQILVPSLPTARQYKLSVAEVFTNSTTSSLDSTALGSFLPFAQTGDRVHAISITGGAKIYEKTTTGWVEYAVTVVP